MTDRYRARHRRGHEGARRSAGAMLMLLAAAATMATPLVSGLPTTVEAAAGATSLTATPNYDLANGQYVRLDVAGYPADSGVATRECTGSLAHPPTDLNTQCAPNQRNSFIVTDHSGKGQTYLPIQAGQVYASASNPRDPCGSDNPCFPCDQTHPCLVAAMTDPEDLSTATFAVVRFGPSPDACRRNDTSVLGSGSAVTYRAMYKWQGAVCQKPLSLTVDYAQENSPDGVSNWLTGLADYAVTGSRLTAGQKAAVDAAGRRFAYGPLSASGVVIAYQIYDRRGPQITNLKLTPDLVAKIFTGQLVNFNSDDQLKTLNPNVRWPRQTFPYVRAEHSSQSLAFSQWLVNLAYDDELSNLTPPWSETCATPPNPCAVFPQYPFVTGKQGADAVGLAVADQTFIHRSEGRIGFMDASTAAFYGLPTATIETAPGHDVDATSQTILKAVEGGTKNRDGTVSFAYDDADLDAYPIPMLTYALAPTNKIDPKLGKILARFLTFAVGDTGQGLIPAGYAALPADLAAETVAAAKLIPQTVPTTPPPHTTTPPYTPPYSPPYTVPYSPPYTAPYISPTYGTLPSEGSSVLCPSATTSQPAIASPTPSTLPASVVTSPPVPGPSDPSPSPTATLSPSITPSASPTDPCAAVLGSSGSARAVLAPPIARFVLPTIALMGLVGLTAGPSMQYLAKRKASKGGRPLPTPGSDA